MDSIKEKILKNIKTTLETITTTNGYDNTIASVQRHQIGGQDTVSTPYIIVVQGDETTVKEGPDPYVTKRMEIHFDVITRQDTDTDNRNADEVMNSIEADIEKSMQLDSSRGGNAFDTGTLEVIPLAVEEGSVDINAIMSLNIEYRQRRDDPKLK